eukprot:jgi/Picre1/29820/NNA_005202.t1
MKGVVQQSTFLVTVLYTVVALAGYVLFGEHVQGDVLKDLTIRFTGMLVGQLCVESVGSSKCCGRGGVGPK